MWLWASHSISVKFILQIQETEWDYINTFSLANSNKLGSSVFFFFFFAVHHFTQRLVRKEGKVKSKFRPRSGYFAVFGNSYTLTQERQWGIGQTQDTNKSRLAWQARRVTQYISQLWKSLAGEQIATEASTKSFNLSNYYQEDVKHEYPKVQALASMQQFFLLM